MRIALLALPVMAITCTNAHAATAPAVFTGTVLSTCVLTVGTPGIIAPNSDFSALDSRNPGGLPSSVSALTTGGSFSISAVPPASFTTGSSTGVTFATAYTLSGATTASGVIGTATTLLGIGVTNISVDLAATKSSGSFQAGAYTAAVTVRCE